MHYLTFSSRSTTFQLVEKVGVLGKSFGKITLLKKNQLTNTFVEMFVSILRTAVLTPGVLAWETKWILPRHFDLIRPENGQENHRDDK